jgi:hypothetical protein
MIGSSLLRKIMIAIAQKAKHDQALQDLTTSLDSQQVATWTAELDAWENDPSQPNPFHPRSTASTSPSDFRSVLTLAD